MNLKSLKELGKKTQFDTITSMLDTGLITLTVITRGASSAAFASAAGLPVGITLFGTRLIFSLAVAITGKYSKIFIAKQEKHDAIKLLAKSKLDSIANIISQRWGYLIH